MGLEMRGLGKGPAPRRSFLMAGLFLAAAALAGVILYELWDYRSYLAAPEPGITTPVLVSIDPGMSFNQASNRLQQKGVISRRGWFGLCARGLGVTTRIQAGDYTFHPGMTPLQVLDMIIRGDITTVRLSVPEGFNLWEVAYRLETLGPWTADIFLALARDHEKAEALGIPVDSLEGYLFPAGYELKMSMSEEDVIDLMLQRGEREKTEERLEKAKSLGFTWHEILTLASLIERETGVVEEMPRIASVFANRLQRNMFLQSDPTAIYGIKDQAEGVTPEDLKNTGPYNTYLNKGLPPGPICNPGVNAIEAALSPEQTDFLYFVATGDGGHAFAKTMADHRRNINSYRRRLREQAYSQ